MIQAKLEPFNWSSFTPEENENRIAQPLKQLPNLWYYKGQIDSKTGLKDGRGVQVWPDGGIYEGYWKDDKATGIGRMIHSDGDVYNGEFKEDKLQGYGKHYISSLPNFFPFYESLFSI